MAWSVAEGGRGRRWRWTVAGEGTLEHAGLIELDGSGRFARLELETTVGMLTLHPAGDGATAHGNVVRADRVDPLRVSWDVGSGIWLVRDPFASALLARTAGPTLVIAPDLTLSVREAQEAPVGQGLDDRGVPVLLESLEWPLEV